MTNMSRRAFTLTGLSALATPALIRPARAQGGSLVAATFPGSWEDAYRTVLTPMVQEAGYELTIAPSMAQDQIARLMASPGQPPYDALLVSPGQSDILVKEGLIEEIDPTRLKNWDKLTPAAQDAWGPHVTIEVNGIAYNPEVVDKPSGYRALFEDEQYDYNLALIGFGSNTATMAYTEINKAYGGTYENMQPVFDLLESYLPKIGAIATSGSNQMTMYQQGEIAVFMASTGNVARLRELGMPCEFAHPETGSPSVPVAIHMVKGASNPDAVYAYMDAAIDAAAQVQLAEPPTAMIPTNTEVPYSEVISQFVTPEQVANAVYPDWQAINEHRSEWTETFDRLVVR
ncbi:ABC transporter substrate-binding protein [Salipiger pallidus]|uniref:ABC transporter substrate-binding protein n=1 Tax=Salipiger pallidus TaxID=1775170 RepID=A0A8J3EFZ2_9RHOB|nr:extracellular solute-binding protein [Salipiger pallidus]GGG69370.1 ABC transporter substrate-binding protein [Salipiger pallidus]